MLTYPGSIDATQAEDLDEEIFRSCHHWHLASYFLLRNLRSSWPQLETEMPESGPDYIARYQLGSRQSVGGRHRVVTLHRRFSPA